jgi:serine/threonine protein phosphatase PrpC
MSRSLGDNVAHSVGVISTPDITIHELTPFDKFLILATDGLWEFISNDKAIQIVAEQ